MGARMQIKERKKRYLQTGSHKWKNNCGSQTQASYYVFLLLLLSRIGKKKRVLSRNKKVGKNQAIESEKGTVTQT